MNESKDRTTDSEFDSRMNENVASDSHFNGRNVCVRNARDHGLVERICEERILLPPVADGKYY